MRHISRGRPEIEAKRAHALGQDIATALFNSSSRFRRQLQTRQELEAIAEAVVEHLRAERWLFDKRPPPLRTEVSPAIKAYLAKMSGQSPDK